MSKEEDGYFKLKKLTKFDDIAVGKEKKMPESDLCFQNDTHIAQYEYIKAKVEKKIEVKPGVYELTDTDTGVKPIKTELKVYKLLEEIDNTTKIIGEAKLFFSKLDIYEKLNRPKKRGVLLYSDPGMGKCLGKDTPILMFDGSTKMVQEIKEGDLLMGPDSKQRAVLSTTTGKEQLYRIIPKKGDSYVVNESHILSLRESGPDSLHNISVKDYLQLSACKKERLKGWRTGVEFANNDELIIDPYFLGLWLGDGTSSKAAVCSTDVEILNYVETYYKSLGLQVHKTVESSGVEVYRATSGLSYGPKDRNILMNMLRSYSLINNKHIPLVYSTASRKNRFELLAGIVDADGSIYNGIVDFCFKSEKLTNNIAFLARSLGLAAYIKPTKKTCTNSINKTIGDYFRLQISGNIDQIPTKLLRKQAPKRKQIKNHLRTGIAIEKLTVGDYYGFEINEDKLFLLGDFTVTHNTSAISKFCLDFVKEDPGTVVLIWPTAELEAKRVSKFLSAYSEFTKECTRLILIIEDIGGMEYENGGRPNQVDSGLLNLLDGVGIIFKLPTFIVATTNHPENLLGALANRPGRFDLMLELPPPNLEEKIKLMQFIAQRPLTEEERNALNSNGVKRFSIAHLEEVVVRSMLHDKTIPIIIKELISHYEKFKRGFGEEKSMGIGI